MQFVSKETSRQFKPTFISFKDLVYNQVKEQVFNLIKNSFIKIKYLIYSEKCVNIQKLISLRKENFINPNYEEMKKEYNINDDNKPKIIKEKKEKSSVSNQELNKDLVSSNSKNVVINSVFLNRNIKSINGSSNNVLSKSDNKNSASGVGASHNKFSSAHKNKVFHENNFISLSSIKKNSELSSNIVQNTNDVNIKENANKSNNDINNHKDNNINIDDTDLVLKIPINKSSIIDNDVVFENKNITKNEINEDNIKVENINPAEYKNISNIDYTDINKDISSDIKYADSLNDNHFKNTNNQQEELDNLNNSYYQETIGPGGLTFIKAKKQKIKQLNLDEKKKEEHKSYKNNNRKEPTNYNTFCESFFIAGINSTNLELDIDFDETLAPCNHSDCSIPFKYKAKVLTKYEKEIPEVQISHQTAALCFPQGVKLCFTDNPLSIKHPKNFLTYITNSKGERFYLMTYQYYIRIKSSDFQSMFKPDVLEEYFINIPKLEEYLGKNNDFLDQKFQKNIYICSSFAQRKYVFIPQCICLISKYPYFKQMEYCLESIVKLLLDKNENVSNKDIMKFIRHLILELPIPPNNKRLLIHIPYHSNALEIPGLYYKDLALTNFHLVKLFKVFNIETLVNVFYLLILEQKTIFIGDDIDIVFFVIDSMISLLYPLKYHNNIIPVFCNELIEIVVECFVPCLMGISENFYNTKIQKFIETTTSLEQEVFMVFINRNTIELMNEKGKKLNIKGINKKLKLEFPEDLYKYLIKELKALQKIVIQEEKRKEKESKVKSSNNSNSNSNTNANKEVSPYRLEKNFRDIFSVFMVKVFGDYKRYIPKIINNNNNNCNKRVSNFNKSNSIIKFETEFYLSCRDSKYKKFYESFVNTQNFSQFINSNNENYTYFDKLCLKYGNFESKAYPYSNVISNISNTISNSIFSIADRKNSSNNSKQKVFSSTSNLNCKRSSSVNHKVFHSITNFVNSNNNNITNLSISKINSSLINSNNSNFNNNNNSICKRSTSKLNTSTAKRSAFYYDEDFSDSFNNNDVEFDELCFDYLENFIIEPYFLNNINEYNYMEIEDEIARYFQYMQINEYLLESKIFPIECFKEFSVELEVDYDSHNENSEFNYYNRYDIIERVIDYEDFNEVLNTEISHNTNNYGTGYNGFSSKNPLSNTTNNTSKLDSGFYLNRQSLGFNSLDFMSSSNKEKEKEKIMKNNERKGSL